MSEVPAKQRYALIGTVLGLVNKDIKMIVENLNILEFFDSNTNTDLVISTLNMALNNATDGGRGSASTLNFTRLNQNLESASDKLPFKAPPFYTLIVRTLTILEGLALYVDPNFRLIRGAYPFVAKQILNNPNDELTRLLSTIIITPDKKIRWDRLEKFLSIASSADDALAGNFEALKDAQERSDLIKAYSGYYYHHYCYYYYCYYYYYCFCYDDDDDDDYYYYHYHYYYHYYYHYHYHYHYYYHYYYY